jgi:hypothetical protein
MKADTKRPRSAHRKSSSDWRPWNDDPVLMEVYAIRDSYAQQHGYDVARIVKDLKERERAHGSQTPPR